jgi:hypothetical protein
LLGFLKFLRLYHVFVAHLVLERVNAVLLQGFYFFVFLGLSFSEKLLVLVAAVCFPIDTLFHLLHLGRHHLLFVHLLPLL